MSAGASRKGGGTTQRRNIPEVLLLAIAWVADGGVRRVNE